MSWHLKIMTLKQRSPSYAKCGNSLILMQDNTQNQATDATIDVQEVAEHAVEVAEPRRRAGRVSRYLLRPLFWIASLGVTGVAVGAVAVLAIFHIYSKDLPDSGSLADYQPAGMTRLYANDGSLLAEYATERRIFVPFEEIPRHVIQAFIAAEDQNFYQHRGIDPSGILRAFLKNIRNYGANERSLVGGSTITQQVVKNFLLTREKSIDRKIKEAILALRITQNYSKDRILELYLNEIYLGMGAYGVAAASLEYFGKEPHALSTEEVALLAAMPKAPAYYDPHKRPEEALERRNYVLTRMHEDGYINDAEYERTMATPLGVREERFRGEIRAPFFSEEVRRSVLRDYGKDNLYKGNLYITTTVDPRAQAMMDRAYRQALRTYDRRHGYRGAIAQLESLDGWLEAVSALEKTTPLIEEQRLAVVLELKKRHAVLGFADERVADAEEALVDEAEALTVIPEASDETMQEPEYVQGTLPTKALAWARPRRPSGALGAVPKKPGDILKVKDVVLVAPHGDTSEQWALEQIPEVSGAMVAMRPDTGEVVAMTGGYSFAESEFNRATQARRQPGSAFKPFVYMAAMERGFTPSSIVVDAPIEVEQGPGKPLWRPQNYGGDFLGPTTLRVGLEKSRNVMTVHLAQMLGLDAVAHVGERLGVYDNLPPNYANVLGAQETTVMRLAAAYSMLANGGLKVVPTLIKRIDDAKGHTIYRADTRECTHCNTEQGGLKQRLKRPPEIPDARERVIDPRIAYQMVSLLRGVVQRGTATRANTLGFEVAGKTGTTNDSRDAWFMGMTQDLVVGTYIGFDKPRGMGRRETGGRVALPAFIDFMKAYYKDAPPPDFVKPEGVLEIAVDRYTGVPPLPWQPSEQIITETFVTGGSIFIPGEDIAYVPPDALQEEQNEDGFVDYDAGNEAYRSRQAFEEEYYRQQQTGYDRQQGGIVHSQPQYYGYTPVTPQGQAAPPDSAHSQPPTQPDNPWTGQQQRMPPAHPQQRERRRYDDYRRPSTRARPPVDSGTGGLY